jgi:hypothetical protein
MVLPISAIPPNAAGAAALSFAVSFLVGRCLTIFTLPAPMVAAKFTAATVTTYHLYDRMMKEIGTKDTSNKSALSLLTNIVCLSYGTHVMFNPDKSYLSLFKLTVLAGVSRFIAEYAIEKLEPKEITRSVLDNSHKIACAAGFTWLISSKIGYDPKVMLVTTIFTSVLWYASAPLDNHITAPYLSYFLRVQIVAGISAAYRTAFNINTALYNPLNGTVPFFNTLAIAGATLFACDYLLGTYVDKKQFLGS